MLNILDFTQQGPLLHFTFDTGGFEEHEWHHTAPVEPIVSLFNDTLLPLAQERGEALTAEEVIQQVGEAAARTLTPLPAVDWLGLALVAAQRFREATAKLASGETQRHQEECTLTDRLATVLEHIYENLPRRM